MSKSPDTWPAMPWNESPGLGYQCHVDGCPGNHISKRQLCIPASSEAVRASHRCRECGAEWRRFGGGMSLVTSASLECTCMHLDPIPT